MLVAHIECVSGRTLVALVSRIVEGFADGRRGDLPVLAVVALIRWIDARTGFEQHDAKPALGERPARDGAPGPRTDHADVRVEVHAPGAPSGCGR